MAKERTQADFAPDYPAGLCPSTSTTSPSPPPHLPASLLSITRPELFADPGELPQHDPPFSTSRVVVSTFHTSKHFYL